MPNEGAVDCKNYRGVMHVTERKCCGGKKVTVTRIDCPKRAIPTAETECIAEVCPYYEVNDK